MGGELGKDYVFALGTFKDSMNEIRIAEKTGFAEDLLDNGDLAHTVHHEIGHAVNYWLGDRSGRPFKYVSDLEHFATQFEEDLAQTTNAAITAKGRLEYLFPGDTRKQMDEAFAVMFAHVSCPSNTEYAKDMREAFDGYYKLVEAYRKDRGI
jgi:hypothetical protein